MNKTLKRIVKILLVILAILFLIRLFSGSEDSWICVAGEWVKHGNPSAPMPSVPCR